MGLPDTPPTPLDAVAAAAAAITAAAVHDGVVLRASVFLISVSIMSFLLFFGFSMNVLIFSVS